MLKNRLNIAKSDTHTHVNEEKPKRNWICQQKATTKTTATTIIVIQNEREKNEGKKHNYLPVYLLSAICVRKGGGNLSLVMVAYILSVCMCLDWCIFFILVFFFYFNRCCRWCSCCFSFTYFCSLNTIPVSFAHVVEQCSEHFCLLQTIFFAREPSIRNACVELYLLCNCSLCQWKESINVYGHTSERWHEYFPFF